MALEKKTPDGDAFRNMNLSNATRAGWEDKMKCLDQLAKLSAEGYITSEEHDARSDWISNAVTKEQLDIPFKDLPAVPRYINVKNIKPARTPNGPWTCMFWSIFMYTLAAASFEVGHMINIMCGLMCFLFGIFWTVMFIRRAGE